MASKRYFEDYTVGETVTSHAHTVTEQEMRWYIQATDSEHPYHSDPEYCRSQGLRGILIHGSLVAGIVDGFLARYISPEGVKALHYGYDKARWTGVVYPGDAIHSEFKLVKAEVRDEAFGLLTFAVHTYNQDHKLVLYTEDLLLVARRQEGEA